MPAGEAGGAEEPTLLAVPPGSRRTDRLDRSKGKKYDPKKIDMRPAGARKRHNAAKWAREKGSGTIRNIVPGKGDIEALITMDGAAIGINENDQSIYTGEISEENQLFQVNDSIRDLIAGLEDQTQETSEQQNEDKT